MNWMKKMERKFGRYAVSNLMLYISIAYGIGEIVYLTAPEFLDYLALDFGRVLHGEIWRLITFIVYPPSDNLLFVLLSIYVYYVMGATLERRWGTFAFNLYIVSGIFFNIVAAIVTYFAFGQSFTVGTYYLNLSLFFAFVTEFSETRFLLFFLIPIKAKWLGIIDGVYFLLTIIGGLAYYVNPAICYRMLSIGIPAFPPNSVAAIFSILNFVLFWYLYRKSERPSRQQKQVRREFRERSAQAQKMQAAVSGMPRHRCAVCGKTEKDDPEMEFRFCSKCEGDYEYCMDHLYTHQHVTGERK